MTNTEFKEEFQYFSVNVPTNFPSTGASDPLAAQHQGSPNSYLRLGDTPTAADLNGQDEPGLEQRSELTGTPAWPLDLYRSFAPDSSDTTPNGDVLRVNAGSSEPLDVDGNYYKNVGWLDHSNGHRVSTTHGDKVEIITGNYKLVVLGREGDAQKSTGFDMSGGHTGTWAQTPGAIRTISADADSFKVTQVTDEGHEYNVFDGLDTYHLVGGGAAVSVMGGANDRTEKGSGPAELVVDAAWSNTIFDSDFAETVINIDAGDLSLLPGVQQAPGGAAGAPLSPWPLLSETADLKTHGAAFSIEPRSFADVERLPKAQTILDARSGQQVVEWTAAGTIDEQLKADSVRERIEAGRIENTITANDEILEVWQYDNYVERFFGQRRNITVGNLETELHMAGALFDVGVSMATQDVAVGGVRLGLEARAVYADLTFASFILEFSAGFQVERDAAVTALQAFSLKTYLASVSDYLFSSENGAIDISNHSLTLQG